MGIQHTTNYGIAYADEQTALAELAAVTQEVAESLDDAMGRAGYTPPDATTFAALAARVAAIEAEPTVAAGRVATNLAAVNNVSGTVTFPTAFPSAPRVTLTCEVPTASSIDLVGILVGPVTATGFGYRVRERAAASVTVNAFLNWTAIL